MTYLTAVPWRTFKSDLFTLMIILSCSLSSFQQGEARDLQWQKSDAQSAVSVRRVKGDAIAVRQRLISEGPNNHKAITELSHLTSGCALTLHWKLSDPSSTSSTSDHLALSSIQRGSRRLAKKISAERWPKGQGKTRSASVELTLPHDIILSEVQWHRCGWGPQRHPSQSATANQKNSAKPTLPSGAKSSKAVGLGALLGQENIKESLLETELKGSNLVLNSDYWAFSVVLESQIKPIKTDTGWRWGSPSPSKGEQSALKLRAHIVHAAPDLTPIQQSTSDLTPHSTLKEWEVLLDLLSYQEGVIDGLGSNGVTREWAALLMMAVLPIDHFSKFSPEWCEAALIGAIRSLPAWPHIFRAYKRPMKPLDGRLILPIALERYLLHHPQGQKRLPSFLQRKVQGIAITSVIKRHLQDMISRVAFFANRPSKKHLISINRDLADEVQEGELHYSFTESVALVPKSLSAITKLLTDKRIKASLGAAIGLKLRSERLQEVWTREARSFFGRQLEVYEARARIENWGRFLELPIPDAPALAIKKDIKYYNALLNEDPPFIDAYSGLDMLWGQHEDTQFVRLLNTMRPFPAGIVTATGVINANKLPFVGEISPISSERLTPNMGAAALWIYALNRQLKRQWPYKLIIKLEDARAGIWSAISAPNIDDRTALSPWQNPLLSVFDATALFITEPPPIEARQGVNAKDLR